MSGTEADEAVRRRERGIGKMIKLRDDDGSFDMDAARRKLFRKRRVL
ncbi:MAG: hypothetical protein JWM87_57 [Candidatus Eremiobacteraeota bacterium]|nr:hypothetical protein [Candidatus Eremiobacteraeota bacterium]